MSGADLFREAMLVYDDVFNPVYFILYCVLLLAYREWRGSGGGDRGRFAVIAVGWGIGWATWRAYWWFFPTAPQWMEDVLGVTGLLVGGVVIAGWWVRRGLGRHVPRVFLLTIGLAAPYTAISVAWNISGHVAFTMAPALYLAAVDRRYAPVVAIPLLMVINRPVVDAHTWTQSVAGLALAAGFVLGGIALLGTEPGRGGVLRGSP